MRAMRSGIMRDPYESSPGDYFTCRIERDWIEVALEFASRTGEVLTPNQARHIGDRAMIKLRKAWAEIGGAA
jgi:hypothetical protein